MQSGRFDYAERISGETFAKKPLLRQVASLGGPIGCIHLGFYRQEFGLNYEHRLKIISYDYELIFALGSYLGMTSADKVYEMIDLIEELGLDAITAGVALGWVTEAFELALLMKKHLKK